jgi:hypothetical protein
VKSRYRLWTMVTAAAMTLFGITGLTTSPASAAAVNGWAASGGPGAAKATAAGSQQLRASTPDGHLCWLWSNGDNEPYNYDAATVIYSEGVMCDGLVNRIQFTLELIYDGVTGDANSVVASRTVSSTSGYPTTSLLAGLTVTGSSCPPGYYTGRISGTITFRSGSPLTVSRTFTSRQSSRSLSCLGSIG